MINYWICTPSWRLSHGHGPVLSGKVFSIGAFSCSGLWSCDAMEDDGELRHRSTILSPAVFSSDLGPSFSQRPCSSFFCGFCIYRNLAIILQPHVVFFSCVSGIGSLPLSGPTWAVLCHPQRLLVPPCQMHPCRYIARPRLPPNSSPTRLSSYAVPVISEIR